MPRWRRTLRLSLLCVHLAVARARNEESTPVPEAAILSTKCTSFCAAPFLRHGTLRRSCQRVCEALQAQTDKDPCLQDLANATSEHLALISYSSGHYIEVAAILSGALNPEHPGALEFLQGLRLDDRGSPAACDAIDDTHYCLVEHVSTPMFLGLCLPETCDSSSVTKILANISSFGNGSADFLGNVRFEAPPGGSSPTTVVCGNEYCLETGPGTLLTLSFVGCLVAACVAGTILDGLKRVVHDRQHEETRPASGGMMRSRAFHHVHPIADERMLTSSRIGSHDPVPQEHGPQENPRWTSGADKDRILEHGQGFEKVDGQKVVTHMTPESNGGAHVAGENEIRVEGGDEEAIRLPLLEAYHPRPNLRRQASLKWVGCLECFALQRNFRRLLSPPRSMTDFGAFDGVRALTSIWMIAQHTFVEPVGSAGNSLTNRADVIPSDGHGFLARFSAQPILQGSMAVDTLFFMSAFLAAVGLLPRIQSVPKGDIGPWVLEEYWRRYVRLMPTAAFVALLYWQVLPLAADGPAWWPMAAKMKDDCRRYWWTQVVFVQNLVPVHFGHSLCVDVSWSLATQMQFFLAAVPLLVLYHRRPRLSVAILLSLAVGSCLLTFWYAFYEDIRFPTLYSSYREHSLKAYMNVFGKPWFRCPTYIIGLLCGIAWHTHPRGLVPATGSRKQPGDRASPGGDRNASVVRERVFIAVGFTSAALMLLLPVYGAYWGNRDMQEVQIPAWADHLYLAFARPCWALGVAVLCGLCFSRLGGMVNTILTLPVWAPLSRLAFACILIHRGLVHWLFMPRSVPYRYTSLELTIAFLGVGVASFGSAAVVHLLVEEPFQSLDSWVRRRSTRRRPGSTR